MVSGYRYRVVSLVGTFIGATIAVLVANHPSTQWLTTVVPVFQRLPAVVLSRDELRLATVTSAFIVTTSLAPLYKPRPQRILDTIFLTQKRVVVAGFAMATVGYFDYTYPLPRSTLALTVGILLVALPAWFLVIRHRPSSESRAVIIGDDVQEIQTVVEEISTPVVGYIAPPAGGRSGDELVKRAVADGSGNTNPNGVECLGGLSRLDEVLIEHDIGVAVLAFSQPDRGEFFGALDACYEHGVSAKIHRDHTDYVLTTNGNTEDPLVDIDLEPLDWQDYIFKRIFDIVFATVGLIAFAPIVVVIIIAIKFDSQGPVLYSQERTAAFGETFRLYKFRTMVPGNESEEPSSDDDNDRITRVGRVLRRTHLDELPQLWEILLGEMSVVGPRAVWTNEESLLEEMTDSWRKRWFVKPGLTGLAQVNQANSTDSETKLRYDLEYIRRQSFWLDIKIVIRQIWLVLTDIAASGTDGSKDEET